MVLQLDFDVGKRDDGKVHVHAAVAQFDHLGGESRFFKDNKIDFRRITK